MKEKENNEDFSHINRHFGVFIMALAQSDSFFFFFFNSDVT